MIKKKWFPVLGLPTEIYRTCLFPMAKVNYVKWCKNSFFGAKTKGDNCLYNFCQVCCDHLKFIYQNAAEKNIIGDLLQLNQESGIKNIKALIDSTGVQKCKIQCKKNYPSDMPAPDTKPPRDPLLGTQKKPAFSCMDIKKWGAETAKSGQFWLELPSKGPQQVFCDMETDKGGWTLFFNYKHIPGQELVLNENKLPTDLKSNSHMYLTSAGFANRDAKELRFLCTEIAKSDKKFWHFKSTNKEILDVAMKGDQSVLTQNSIAQGYVGLKPPGSMNGKYTEAVDKNKIGEFHVFGANPKGGFTAQTFGSATYNSYWTVKGDSPTQDIFECGTSHKSTAFTSPEDSPQMVFTHHSVWFRGAAPSEDEVKQRMMNSIGK